MKSALVTGGSRGIGKAISIKLAKMGLYVIVNYKSNEAEARNTLAQITAAGGQGEILQFDVSDGNAVAKVLETWLANNEDKTIEVLVNNAGIRNDGLLLWMKNEQWDDVIKTNLYSFFYVTRIVLEKMVLKRYGRIINIVSLSGLKGLAGQTNYSAAKGGIIAATKALAQEVAKRGITVNAIAPGFIKTDMTEDLDEAELKKIIPANRFGLPEEVAHATAFLASPDAGYITAQVLSVNGGLYS